MQPKPCVVCLGLGITAGFAAGWCFAVGWDLTGGLEFAPSVENAQGEGRYPC